MKKENKICSLRILEIPEHRLIEREFDLPVEIEYKKSQVTEQDAINSAIKQVNENLPNGLCARIADSEQCILTKGDRSLMQIGIDLFTEN